MLMFRLSALNRRSCHMFRHMDSLSEGLKASDVWLRIGDGVIVLACGAVTASRHCCVRPLGQVLNQTL